MAVEKMYTALKNFISEFSHVKEYKQTMSKMMLISIDMNKAEGVKNFLMDECF